MIDVTIVCIQFAIQPPLREYLNANYIVAFVCCIGTPLKQIENNKSGKVIFIFFLFSLLIVLFISFFYSLATSYALPIHSHSAVVFSLFPFSSLPIYGSPSAFLCSCPLLPIFIPLLLPLPLLHVFCSDLSLPATHLSLSLFPLFIFISTTFIRSPTYQYDKNQYKAATETV